MIYAIIYLDTCVCRLKRLNVNPDLIHVPFIFEKITYSSHIFRNNNAPTVHSRLASLHGFRIAAFVKCQHEEINEQFNDFKHTDDRTAYP